MNVQGVEWIADLVGHARGQQRQGMKALAFDRLEGLLPRFGRIMQNERHAVAALHLDIQGRGIDAQKTRARIGDFKLMMGGSLASVGAGGAEAFPIQFRQQFRDGAALDLVRVPIEQAGDGLVEIDNASVLIDYQHAVLDGIEDGFQEAALARQALDDRLQPFRIQTADAAEETINKTGFRCGHKPSIYLSKRRCSVRHFGTPLRSNLAGEAISKLKALDSGRN